MKSIVKTDTRAKRDNAAREKPVPGEMLPKMNRRCGKFGHKWEYLATGMKVCTNYLCEVRRPYKPNEFIWSEKLQANVSIHVGGLA